MEFNEENFNKIQSELEKTRSENANKEKALQEERAKRKQAREDLEQKENQENKELEEFKAEKLKREEAEAKKKGKYEELLLEKDKTIEELSSKIPAFEEKATKYDEFLNKQLEEKKATIPEERQEFINKVLDGKSYEDQVDLLDGFTKEFGKPGDFKANPDKAGGGVNINTTEFDKAKESGDRMGMLNNAPTIKEE